MFYSFVWYFLIFSFVGWCAEVGYAAVVERKFVNRGFLFGPVCPIYGFGIALIWLIARPLSFHIVLLWLGSVIVTSGIELLTGFVMDKIFHNKWWDYSNFPLNIGGYICLPFSLLWGFACVAVVKLVFPLTDLLIGLMFRPLGIGLGAFFCVLMAADAVSTVLTILGLNKQLEAMERLTGSLHENSEKIGKRVSGAVMNAAELAGEVGEKLADGRQRLNEKIDEYKEKAEERREERAEESGERAARLREKYDALAKTSSIFRRRLLDAFPHMKPSGNMEHLQAIRDRIQNARKARKAERAKKKKNHSED